MESRMVKFYSKESNMVAIHAIPGHFATSHSHINYYIDITSLKTRIQEAKEVARVLHQKIGRVSYAVSIGKVKLRLKLRMSRSQSACGRDNLSYGGSNYGI